MVQRIGDVSSPHPGTARIRSGEGAPARTGHQAARTTRLSTADLEALGQADPARRVSGDGPAHEGQGHAHQALVAAAERLPAGLPAEALQHFKGAVARGQEFYREHVDTARNARRLEELQAARQVAWLGNQGKLDRDEIDWDYLNVKLKTLGREQTELYYKQETHGNAIVRALEDPKLLAAVSGMPIAQKKALLEGAFGVLSRTDAGLDYFNRAILPRLRGQRSQDSLVNAIFDGAGASAGGASLALTMLEGCGSFLARHQNGMDLLQEGIVRALGAQPTPRTMEVVRKAIWTAGTGRPDARDAALRILTEAGLTRASANLEQLNRVFVGVSAGLALKDLLADPSIRNKINAGKSAAEVSDMALAVLKNSQKYGRYAALGASVLKNAAAALGVAVSAMDIYGEGGSIDRGNIAETIGNSVAMGGGIVTAGGLALSATAIGAVAGVPLTVIGAVLGGIGSLIAFLGGDSASRKFLLEHYPRYVKHRGGGTLWGD